MVACCIALCKSRNHTPQGVTFHCFPRNAELRTAWKIRCRREDDFNLDSAKVCSLHFSEESFRRDLESESLGKPCKRRLVRNALPSIFLPSQENSLPSVCKERLRKRKRKESVNSVLPGDKINSSDSGAPSDAEVDDSSKNHWQEYDMRNQDPHSDFEKPGVLICESKLEKHCQALQLQNQDLSQKLKALEEEHMNLQYNCVKEFEIKIGEILSPVFSPAQIQRLFCPDKKTHWKEEDLVRAFYLRKISTEAYDFVRDELKIPLPSLATLKKLKRNKRKTPDKFTQKVEVKTEQSETIIEMPEEFMGWKTNLKNTPEKFTQKAATKIEQLKPLIEMQEFMGWKSKLKNTPEKFTQTVEIKTEQLETLDEMQEEFILPV